ncbi:MAG TPA: radical SAM/Cys-rich domain protein [Spirochaetes bacterium]|nr:radical SAM/Cys-rich domain protein [Spirochaetota bacterium]
MNNRFLDKIQTPIPKDPITTLQINLGRKCNQACHHCHVEASPRRTEEISEDVKEDLINVIKGFKQIKTVDITGGAPEMHHGFREIVMASRSEGKEVIVRSNLTVFFEEGYEDLPDFFAEWGVKIVASLPCYLEENVDALRGRGVYQKSIEAIKLLNSRGYGKDRILDFVYSPLIPKGERFSLAPDQQQLELDYKKYLKEHFGIEFNSLYAFTNLPIGRFAGHLKSHSLDGAYLDFLESNYNPVTLDHLMCRNQLSIDYEGNVYDCDFNQMAHVPSSANGNGHKINIKTLLDNNSLDLIRAVEVRDYCFGCTAGSGSSCSGALA